MSRICIAIGAVGCITLTLEALLIAHLAQIGTIWKGV
jgi:hypothetical protein